ncbi:MAG TPA: 16S rRNA (cytosine(1402)-N(4))-methyltransferase RsmH [Phycisphaerae bacterium]|nr:16S rRNA (cytosine(1402)-N(4))-methyltransferase RsmH [Phycisphaerae bacterium]
MQAPEHGHDPVMVGEVVRDLGLERQGRLVILDCTAGRGGHLLKIAEAMTARNTAAGGLLIAMDVDPENLKYARKRFEEGVKGAGGDGKPRDRLAGLELRTFHANFAEAEDVLEAAGVPGVDGLLADFGVSTNQLLDAKHGLSFNADLALDMRLDPRIRKKASDLLAEWDEKEIAMVLQEYAQERFAWRIARKIVQTRATEPILTTGQLSRLVRSVVPSKYGQIDPATRTFQALRMAVNDEIDSIEGLLAAVPDMMNAGGRAVFISFHSGEDRLVKQAVRAWEETGTAEALTRKPQEPSETEMHRNPRSRSAKLRAARFMKQGSAVREVPEPG